MRRFFLLLGAFILLAGPLVAHPTDGRSTSSIPRGVHPQLLSGSFRLSVAPQSDTLDRQFETANAAYAQGQYGQAVEHYQNVLDAGYTSGALYYNLGNAYVRLGRLGQAIRYYEKSRQLRPRDPKVEHNLEQARRWAGVYPERLGAGPPRSFTGFVRGWSPFTLFLMGILLFGIGAIGAVIWTHSGRRGFLRHPLGWGPVVAGLLLVTGAMGISYIQSHDRRAVVVATEAPLRFSRGAEAADTTLSEGALLELRTRKGQWREVRLANGVTGWVPAEVLGDV